MLFFISILLLLFNFGRNFGAKFPPNAYCYEGEKIDLIQQRVDSYKFCCDITESGTYMNVTYKDDDYVKKYVHINKLENTTRISKFYYKAKDNGESIPCVNLRNTKGTFNNFEYMLLPPDNLFELFRLVDTKISSRNDVIEIWEYKRPNDLYLQMFFNSNSSSPLKYKVKKFNETSGVLKQNFVIKYDKFEQKKQLKFFNYFHETNCTNMNNQNDQLKYTKSDPQIQPQVNFAFDRYKKHHNRDYNGDEHETRKNIFEKNWRLVKKHNSQNLGYKLAMNKFADRIPEEMEYFSNSFEDGHYDPGTHEFPHNETEIKELIRDTPENWDWRIQGKISKVKSQDSCGSCWAFAGTAAVEAALAIKYEINFDLSEQAVLDCAWPYNADGCYGSYHPASAFMYAVKHGIPTEYEYGLYKNVEKKCRINNMTTTYKLEGYTAVTPRSAEALKVAVHKYGPVKVSILSTDNFKLYSSGIYEENIQSNKINHAVLLVGYGVRDGVPYWIIKNSWGEDWGEDGYGLIAAHNKALNILTMPYYPFLE